MRILSVYALEIQVKSCGRSLASQGFNVCAILSFTSFDFPKISPSGTKERSRRIRGARRMTFAADYIDDSHRSVLSNNVH
jgi:hypothetical protein